MEDFITTTSLNTSEITGDQTFKDLLIQYEWTPEPRYAGSTLTYYNKFKNASFSMEQKGGFIEMSANIYLSSSNDVLAQAQCSDKARGLAFAIHCIQTYWDFDMFENVNQI